jgi:hypothetical protein
MEIEYTIGDDIVAVEVDSDMPFKKGDTFICKGLRESQCRCKGYDVNIGVTHENQFQNCGVCGLYWKAESNVRWFNASRFRKLDNLVQINEIHELLKQVIAI